MPKMNSNKGNRWNRLKNFARTHVCRSSRNLNRLRKINAKKESSSSELRVASKIQQSMLPPNHLKPDHAEIVGSLTLKNDISEVTKLSTFLKSVFEKMELDKSLSHQLRLAVEEAVVNVLNYAYPPASEGFVEIHIMSDDHQVKVMIIDTGVPFDPTEQEKTDTSLAIEDRRIGGLGIYMIRELMDTINYERLDGKNILTLMKQI